MKVFRGFEKEEYLCQFLNGDLRFTSPTVYIIDALRNGVEDNERPDISESAISFPNCVEDWHSFLPAILSTSTTEEGASNFGKYILELETDDIASIQCYIQQGLVKYIDTTQSTTQVYRTVPKPPIGSNDDIYSLPFFVKTNKYEKQSEYRIHYPFGREYELDGRKKTTVEFNRRLYSALRTGQSKELCNLVKQFDGPRIKSIKRN